MASVTGVVTIAGDPDDWIATAFDAETHAFAGVAAISGGSYIISGLTEGRAYSVVCRPKSGPVWTAGKEVVVGECTIPSEPTTTPHIYKVSSVADDDPYAAQTVLLLPCNTGFTDIKGHPVTVGGGAAIDTDVKKYGAGSGNFYIETQSKANWKYIECSHADMAIGADFTIDFWFNVKTFSQNQVYAAHLFSTINSTYTSRLVSAYINAYSAQNPYQLIISVVSYININCGTIEPNRWYHLAVTCKSSPSITVSAFLDGVLKGSSSGSDAVVNTGIRFGSYNDTGSDSNYSFPGWIDDIRVTRADRYATNFTPPAPPSTASTEPVWPTQAGATVVDGDITWTNMGRIIQPLVQSPLVAV